MPHLVAQRRKPPLWLQRPYWAREQIPNCVMWLDANSRTFTDTGLTTRATAGDAVKGWGDVAHGSINATEATNGPAFRTGSALHPLYALEFDASNDQLQSSANPIANGDNLTVFSVGVKGATGPRQTRGNTSTDFGVTITANGYSVVLTSGGVQQYDAVNVLYSTGQRFVTCYWLEQNNAMRLYQGSIGTVTETATPKTTLRNSTTNWVLGRWDTTFEAGFWGEVLVYNRALSLAEIDFVMRTLKQKWRL